jgi:hypothetical protein
MRMGWGWLLAVGLIPPACGDDGAPAGDDAPATTSGAGGTAAAPGTGTTTGPALTTGPTPGDSSGGGGDDGQMGECNIWTQDCAEGDKCTPWSESADLIPDDIRCCPVPPNPKLAGEECAVVDYFGSCEDDCDVGTFCMDVDNDGTGVCQPFCTGDSSDPQCGVNESCLFYFAGVPICFPQCDPLLQDCPEEGYGCYPDEDTNGGTGFICMPTIIGSGYEDYCWLLSSCDPGLICVTPEFHPNCDPNFGCCTALCDITEDPDPCIALHPDLRCVSWYTAGQQPPLAMWQNVGACVLP